MSASGAARSDAPSPDRGTLAHSSMVEALHRGSSGALRGDGTPTRSLSLGHSAASRRSRRRSSRGRPLRSRTPRRAATSEDEGVRLYEVLQDRCAGRPADSPEQIEALRDWLLHSQPDGLLSVGRAHSAADRLALLGIALGDLGGYDHAEFLDRCSNEPPENRPGGAGPSMDEPGALRRALLAAIDESTRVQRLRPASPTRGRPPPGHRPSRSRTPRSRGRVRLRSRSSQAAGGDPRGGPGAGGSSRRAYSAERGRQPGATPGSRLLYFLLGERPPGAGSDSDLWDSLKHLRTQGTGRPGRGSPFGDPPLLDARSFGDHEEVARVARLRAGRASRRPGVPYLHDSGLELWQPAWVGAQLPASERRAELSKRTESRAQSTARLVGTSAAYWLAHAAVGQVSVQAVLAHVLLICRLCDEHGLPFANRYLSQLLGSLQARIDDGVRFDVDEAISAIDIDVLRLASVPPHQADRPPLGVGAGPGDEAQGPGAGGTAPRGPPEATAPPRDKKKICFAHDPANGRRCQLGSGCNHEHLDTTQDFNRDRFARAQASFIRVRTQKTKARQGTPPPSRLP